MAGTLHFDSALAAPIAVAPTPPQVPLGVVRYQEPILPTTNQPARVRDYRHNVGPPVEEIVVFNDSLNGLRLDSLAGWSHYDASGKPTAWHIDTFSACGGHAWWCGLVDSTWIYDPNRAGYANNWTQYLANRCPIGGLPAG